MYSKCLFLLVARSGRLQVDLEFRIFNQEIVSKLNGLMRIEGTFHETSWGGLEIFFFFFVNGTRVLLFLRNF